MGFILSESNKSMRELYGLGVIPVEDLYANQRSIIERWAEDEDPFGPADDPDAGPFEIAHYPDGDPDEDD